MFIIGTALYAALSIIFIPIILVLIYILITNSRYGDIISVYGIETPNAVGALTIVMAIYLFMTGFCLGDIPGLLKNTVFIICLVGSAVLSLIIIRIMNFYNRERIKYANVIIADEKICDKITEVNKQLEDMKKTMGQTSLTAGLRDSNNVQITEINSMLKQLIVIHQELQQQKILLNTSLSTKELKNISLKDSKSVQESLNKQTDKFKAHRLLTDDLGNVRDIMRKYNI